MPLGITRVLVAAPLMLVAAGCGARATPRQALLSFESRPDLTPPVVQVRVAGRAASRGFLFIAPKAGAPQKGPEIVDDTGQPVWFDPVPGQATDFRVQTYRGQPVLTWWQGPADAPVPGSGRGHDVIMNRNYQVIASVDGGFGPNTADLHEFELTSHDTALITAYRVVRADLTRLGGSKNGSVADSVVREIDVETGRVLFTWHSLGHVPLSESYVAPSKKGVWDYFHVNSVQEEANGDLLVSARNTSTVYEISHTTGRVLWRLGGKSSTFRLGPGTSFAWQHDARRQSDGTITILDNESGTKKRARVVRLRLDHQWKIATLVQSDVAPKGVRSDTQGNAQLLPDDHTLVGWGAAPRITEYDSAGAVVFDATFPPADDSYRAYRFSWAGEPTTRPAIAVDATSRGVTVCASWNGATGVARWRVLAGAVSEHLHAVSTVPKTGFETRISLRTNDDVFAVEALDSSGAVLATSAAVPPGGVAES